MMMLASLSIIYLLFIGIFSIRHSSICRSYIGYYIPSVTVPSVAVPLDTIPYHTIHDRSIGSAPLEKFVARW